jgi:membrane protein
MVDTSARGRDAAKPTEIGTRGWKEIALRVKDEIRTDNLTLLAAGVAFYAMLGLFPAIIALITIYGLVADPNTIERHVESMVEAVGPAGEVIGSQMEAIGEVGGGALGFGLVASLLAVLWTASSGMHGLIRATNIAYDEPETRSFLRQRGLALLMSLAAIVFVILAIFLIGVVPVVVGFLGLGTVGTVLAEIGRWVFLAFAVVTALGVVYRYAADRSPPQWKWVTPGAAAAALVWLIGSAAFSIYVVNFGSYNETYGALGGVIVLLLWLFLTAFAVLLGAEINAEMELQTERDTTRGESEPRGQREAVKADELPGTDRERQIRVEER